MYYNDRSEIKECPCCGIRIYQETGEGGYIDHVENFAHNPYYISRTAEEIAEAICFDNKSIRTETDIKGRLECFILWDQPMQTKKVVFFTVVKLLQRLRASKEAAKTFCNMTPDVVIAIIKGSNKNDAYISLFNKCYEEATKE